MFYVTYALSCCTNEEKITSNIAPQKEYLLLCDMSDNTIKKRQKLSITVLYVQQQEKIMCLIIPQKKRHQALVVIQSYLCKFI